VEEEEDEAVETQEEKDEAEGAVSTINLCRLLLQRACVPAREAISLEVPKKL